VSGAAVGWCVQGQLAQFQLVPEPVAVGVVVSQDFVAVAQVVSLAKGFKG